MQNSFKSDQLEFPRVREAFEEKEAHMKKLCADKNIDWNEMNIFIRVFKQEEQLELWATDGSKYQLIKSYPFCYLSGKLGPKRKQGDFQVPEGFYHIDRFNPKSLFHLSLGINYPNSSDKLMSSAPRGGDIFIHGDCQSIGCIPITDELIKEVYVAAVQAKENEQLRIGVHIFPFRMKNWENKNLIAYSKDCIAHWKTLEKGYELFESSKKEPAFKVNKEGRYVFF